MKKLLFVSIVLMIVGSLFAATFENGNMESWQLAGAGGPPDYWAVSSTSLTASQETGTVHGGSYSANLTWTSTSTSRFQQLSLDVTAGHQYEFKFYAYDNDPDGRVRVVIRWYDNEGSLISGYYGDYTTDTASWQLMSSGAQEAPSNAVTASVEIRCYDVSGWDGNATVYVDDASFEEVGPLSVELSSFYAVYNQEQLTLHWKTYSEVNNLGWNVYRSTEKDFNTAERINPVQIPGNGTTTGVSVYEYKDVKPVENNTTYYYWLESVENSGNTELYYPISITINEENNNYTPDVPNVRVLKNYPNPFNPNTNIEFNIEEGTKATLTIYNIRGEKVITLFNGKSNGNNIVSWNGLDERGNKMPSGIYLYKLNTKGYSIVKRMVLLK